MALEWKSLVSEPGIWSKNGRGGWCSVWPRSETFGAWVASPDRREITDHPTEEAAKRWCAIQLGEEANGDG
jgi:hypothetical protein